MQEVFEMPDADDFTDAAIEAAAAGPVAADPDAGAELVEEPDPSFTAGEVEALVAASEQAVEVASANTEMQWALSDAVRRYDEGEDDAAAIASEIRDSYGLEAALAFAQHAHQQEAWEDEPEPPESAEEWLAAEEQRIAGLMAEKRVTEAVAAQRELEAAQVRATALEADTNKAFNEELAASRRRHGRVLRGDSRGFASWPEMQAAVQTLLVTSGVDPRTPEEAREAARSLYSAAAEMRRAGRAAETKAPFQAATNAWENGWMLSDAERAAQLVAGEKPTSLAAVAREEFAKELNPEKALMRVEPAAGPLDNYFAREAAFDAAWNV